MKNKKTIEEENKFLREALDYIALVANKKDPHLGRPRSSDKECIFCLAYLALNDGDYGEHFDYKQMAEEIRKP
jgi:O6-methylguanine-DNA--protein-cysteine methyltransferase